MLESIKYKTADRETSVNNYQEIKRIYSRYTILSFIYISIEEINKNNIKNEYSKIKVMENVISKDGKEQKRKSN